MKKDFLKAVTETITDCNTALYVEGLLLVNECHKNIEEAQLEITQLMHELQLFN